MPARASKPKRKGRGSAKRPVEKPDPLQRKVHELANSLEAISLAAQFITRRPKLLPVLETLAGAVRDSRRILHELNAEVRDSRNVKHVAAGR
jgi:hypothetical protein